MFIHLRANLILIAGTLVVCSIGYPALLLLFGILLFPASSHGSLLQDTSGKTIGSQLIAQEFKGEEWFQPRPSAVDYNATGSGGSNYGANNPKLRQRVEASLRSIQASGTVPADAVTASGSGLDPHITLANAQLQAKRIAQAWARKTQQEENRVLAIINKLVVAQAVEPMSGLFGSPPLLNVLQLNLELYKAFTIQR